MNKKIFYNDKLAQNEFVFKKNTKVHIKPKLKSVDINNLLNRVKINSKKEKNKTLTLITSLVSILMGMGIFLFFIN